MQGRTWWRKSAPLYYELIHRFDRPNASEFSSLHRSRLCPPGGTSARHSREASDVFLKTSRRAPHQSVEKKYHFRVWEPVHLVPDFSEELPHLRRSNGIVVWNVPVTFLVSPLGLIERLQCSLRIWRHSDTKALAQEANGVVDATQNA